LKKIPEIIKNIESYEFNKKMNESIEIYLWLKNNKSNNSLYRLVYSAFYGLLIAWLWDKLKDEYFTILFNWNKDLVSIISKLYNIPNVKWSNSIQFSFATKIININDESKPIYDSKIKEVLGIKLNYYSNELLEVKIEKCNKVYKEMLKIYDKLLKEDSIKNKIKNFKDEFNLIDNSISDIKILDFILWDIGKELEKKKKDWIRYKKEINW